MVIVPLRWFASVSKPWNDARNLVVDLSISASFPRIVDEMRVAVEWLVMAESSRPALGVTSGETKFETLKLDTRTFRCRPVRILRLALTLAILSVRNL